MPPRRTAFEVENEVMTEDCRLLRGQGLRGPRAAIQVSYFERLLGVEAARFGPRGVL